MIKGYQFQEKIYESQKTLVYRATKENDGLKVIIKLPLNPILHLSQTIRSQQKYSILAKLTLPNVTQIYTLEKYRNDFAIVTEDFGAADLSELVKSTSFGLHQFLKIAIQVVNGLGQLHSHKIIHKDINPSNILMNMETGEVKINDFGYSSLIENELQAIQAPEMMEGTLNYMSPEQTGRMNRTLDYRTDFYSLGITFYELLTGKLPFSATDPIEMVHCHLAKTLNTQHLILKGVPAVLTDMVVKLTAKKAEDRYQSSIGIRFDLETMLSMLESDGSVSPFKLGTQDISTHFRVSQKLYGREKEVEMLLETFERVSNGKSELFLVSGYSGIGKTVLVNEVQKPIVIHKGYFISGKFDQYQRNIPFSSFIQAFQDLIGQLIKENEQKVEDWKTKLTSALGNNGQVIIDVIPAVEYIIGAQPPVPMLTPAETQNRFSIVFQDFVSVFTKKEHPLVLFLDDLQWADSASLKLIKDLISNDQSNHLLIIGAYRDNEVSPTHPTIQTISEIEKEGIKYGNIKLKPLDRIQINQLLDDSLIEKTAETPELCSLLMQKTNGNPFFINQLLKTLHQQGNFTLNQTNDNWSWDLNELKTTNITENVVELMVNKIRQFSTETQNLLKIASTIGNIFNLKLLSIAADKNEETVLDELWSAIQEGILVESLGSFRFLHDQLQQSAYSLISEAEKKPLHLKIGRLLLLHLTEHQLEESLFDIVNHLNQAKEIITQPDEKASLVELNLKAGVKARNATAYSSAMDYLKTAISLLPSESWQSNYKLTLGIFTEAVTAAYLTGDFALMDLLAGEVLTNAKTILDKVPVYIAKNDVCVAENRKLDGIMSLLQVLKLLGVSFPENPEMTDIQAGLQNTSSKLAIIPVHELVDLPLMTDAEKLAAMEILVNISAPCYQSFPALFPLVVFEQINISLEYGNCQMSCFGYMTYAMIISGLLEDFESANRFGKMAIELAQKLEARKILGKIVFLFNNNIRHHKEHLGDTLPDLLESSTITMELGDLEYASLTILSYIQHLFYVGEQLDKVRNEMKIYTDLMRNVKQKVALNYANIYFQTVLNLCNDCVNPEFLNGEVFNEMNEAADRGLTALYCIHSSKAMLGFWFENYEEAEKNIEIAKASLPGAIGLAGVPHVYFYDSLIKLALYNQATEPEKERLLIAVSESQAKLKYRADHAPANLMHKWNLVEAERQRIIGNRAEAISFYDQAIAEAKAQKYINEEALANELAAKFFYDWGKPAIGNVYMNEAFAAYENWGANAKVAWLKKKYNQLNLATKHIASLSNSSHGHINLDLISIMKAAKVISSENNLNKLLDKIQQILIENAGAQNGAIILEQNGKWQVVSHLFSGTETNTGFLNTDFENCPKLPKSVIRYVIATRETVLLNDAVAEGEYRDDPHVVESQIKSLLCLPIMMRGKLQVILYLENSITPYAFTNHHLDVLNLLSSQIVISLENAIIPELTEAKEHFELIFNTSPDAAIISSIDDGKVININTGFTRMTGYTEDEILGKSSLAINLWKNPSHRINLVSALKNNGFVDNYEDIFVRKDGSHFYGLVSAKTINIHGNMYIISVTRDITEREKARADLQETNEKLNRINAEKDKFFSIIAHDLRSPFSSFLGLTQTMAEELPSLTMMQVQDIARSMSKSATNLYSLLNNLLEWSQIQRGSMPFKPEDLLLGVLVTESIELIMESAKTKKIEITNDIAVGLEVFADKNMLHTVIRNLVSNAVKFTAKGGNVGVSAKTNSDNTIEISVHDNGIGMSNEMIKNLFRIDLKTSRLGTEGELSTGIGLLLCKEFIEKHGGKIWAESDPDGKSGGRGSTFWFSIPNKLPSIQN